MTHEELAERSGESDFGYANRMGIGLLESAHEGALSLNLTHREIEGKRKVKDLSQG